jgi:four helix bundle protein
MQLDELRVYTLSMEMGEKVWNIVVGWNYFAKDTIGKQLVRAVDSVASNLSEGFGRYHFKETINFGYYSRGSLYETRTWLTKAHNRGLITGEVFNQLSVTFFRWNCDVGADSSAQHACNSPNVRMYPHLSTRQCLAGRGAKQKKVTL